MLVRRPEALPPLAWLLDLRPPRPTLVCGGDVELLADGFFEGCWAGAFAAGEFDRARHVFGSGARRTGGGRWLFVPPSHTLEAIYFLQQGNGYVASNSLAFLTRWAGIELPFDPGIAARMISVRDGTDCYQEELFQGAGWSIRRVCFDNVELGPEGLRRVPKPAFTERFADFATYRAYLLKALGAVAANGADPRRRCRYELSSTCSSGYDSTACTALVAQLGARRAFTIASARGGGSDSGRAIIERLGLEVVEVDRPVRPEGDASPEAEFIATGMGGDEFPFAAFAPHLRYTILLTGLGGERLWGLEGPISRNAHQNDEPAGASLAEFRLRCGFVHLPAGWIGFESQPELRLLCWSDEMRPWRLGTDYERPIARRLIEESGVPRGMFATVKLATSMSFNYAPLWWSKATLKELRQLEHRHLKTSRDRLAYRVGCWWRTWGFTAFYGVKKLGKRAGIGKVMDGLRDRLFPGFYGAAYTHPRYGSMAFLWAQAKIRERYPQAEDLNLGASAAAERTLMTTESTLPARTEDDAPVPVGHVAAQQLGKEPARQVSSW